MKTPFFPFKKTIHLWVLLGYASLVIVLFMTFWNLDQTVKNVALVSHRGNITDRLIELFLDLNEAEYYQKSFLLSGDEDSLSSYQAAVTDIQKGVAQLQDMTADMDHRDPELQKFNTMIQHRLRLLYNDLDQFTAQGPHTLRETILREAILKRKGHTAMNQFRDLIRDVSNKNLKFFEGVDESAHKKQTFTIIAMPSGIVLTLIIGLFTLWKLRKDLLDRQHLQRRMLEEAKLAEVGRLIGDISHDIKNMLTPVQMGLSLLETELKEFFQGPPQTNQDQRQQVQSVCADVISMARRGSGRIQERMKEIAEAVKGRSGPPHFSACQVSAIVDNVFEALRLYAEEKGVSLHQKSLDSLPNIRADQKRLFNAFYNLVNNAIPEVPSGGAITVSGELAPDKEHVLLQVKDTGRGMPPEIQKSLFTEKVLSNKPGGTGLGTKIVKDVVDSHGGTIGVESEEGKGTTFTIRLPKDGPFASAA